MKITRKLIDDARSPAAKAAGIGAWTKSTLKKLGVPMPLRKGWKDRILGKEIPDGYFAISNVFDNFFEISPKHSNTKQSLEKQIVNNRMIGWND